MALYERLLGRVDNPQPDTRVEFKIGLHGFNGVIAEFSRGRLTGAQAQAAITLLSGAPLDAGEVTEIQALLATITGTATAKLARAKEIDDVLILGEHGVVQYDSPTKVKTRLGV